MIRIEIDNKGKEAGVAKYLYKISANDLVLDTGVIYHNPDDGWQKLISILAEKVFSGE